MTNISKKDVFVSLIIAISILLLTFGCVYAVHSQTAYADYENVVNNPNSIVYFNQVFLNTNLSNQTYAGVTITRQEYQATLNGTATATDWLNLTLNLINGHIYYYRNNFDFNSNYSGVRIEGTSTQAFYTNDFILNIADTTTYFGYYFYNGQTYNNLLIKPILIDLTQMYGQNSEPDLDECRRIFTADYYNYNIGTPVAYSQMDAFAQGVDSVIANLDTTIDSVTIVNTAQPYLSNYRDSKIEYYTNTGNYPETRYTDILVFKNACYIPFLSSLESGTIITIKGDFYDRDLYDFQISISVLGDNGQLSLVDTLQAQLSVDNYSKSYSLPFACNGIVIQNLKSTDEFIEILYPTIEYQSNNLGNIIANSYQSGYNTAKSYYDSYYGYDGVGYNDIYNLGYQRGINVQLSEANRHFYTFPQFLGALFDVPVKTITSLLDFEVLGFNLKNFFFSLITLSIVFAIIKFILVRSGDK